MMSFGLNNCQTFKKLLSFSTYFVKRKFSFQAIRLQKISHVIFDFDGVIMDTETIFYDTNIQTMQHFGSEYTIDLKLGQMGRQLNEGTEWLLKTTGLSKRGITVEQYISIYDKILKKMLNEIPEMPGARKLINHLHKNKIPMAICTGSSSHEFQLKTKNCQDLINKFPLIVLAGDDPEVKKGKPAPDPYIVTMKRMNLPLTNSKNVLVFEDSVNGALSGIAAKNSVIWIPQNQFMPKNWNEIKTKIESQLTEILPSLQNFVPEKYGFPPY